jgi:hypothetical protein
MRITILALALITPLARGFQANPLSNGPAPSVGQTTTSTASVSGYTDRNTWAAAAGGSPTLVDFDSLADGTLVTGTGALAAWGVADCSGFCTYLGITTSQYVYCSCTMNFPMFTAGTLPSEPNYFANDRNPSVYATGEFTLVYSQPTTACGAYVADGAPLAGFTIEIFDSGGGSLGSINVPPRTLPNSFAGIVSTVAFASAKFKADDQFDSWGIDNLEHVGAGIGSKYCTANANSTGAPADISASGSASSGAGNLQLDASPVPNQNGIFFHGANQVQIPFGNGFMCTNGGITRGAVIAGSGNLATYTYDNSDTKHSLGAFVGSTRNFQYWFRDPMGGGAFFNLSNAMSIAITP